MIPLVDLKRQYTILKTELDLAISVVLVNADFIMGSAVSEFEQSFAKYCQTIHAIGVASGTSALQLAMHALGIGQGDEVITVAHTFIATCEPISLLGAKPVFVDVDPESFTLDPSQLEKAISSKTKAIIPVHLYGQCANMTAILEIAKQYNIPVIEDAAQAHGAEHYKQLAGSMGDIGCFSFYPGKNLGAYGDAGAVTTNSETLAKKVAQLRDHGRSQKYLHDVVGYGERLDTLQAGILNVKLKHLERWTKQRREIAQRYSQELQNVHGIQIPLEAKHNKSVYHLYVIQHDKRDQLRQHLQGDGISSGIHYPTPVHLQPAYRHLGYMKDSLPITETLASRILSLPIFPEMSDDEVSQVIDSIKRFQQLH